MKKILLFSMSLILAFSMSAYGQSTCATSTALPNLAGGGTHAETATVIVDGTGGGVGGGAGTYDAAWFSFTPTTNGTLDVSACNGGADTRLYIHDNCAGPSIANNDDSCATGTGSNYASEVTGTAVTGGTTYYIEWDDRWSTGPFDWNVTFTPPPACQAPTALTATGITTSQADLGWTENNSPPVSLWDIELGAAGFTPTGTATETGVATNPYTYTGLTTATSYDYYVRADCGSGTTSTWEGPFTFTTSCISVTSFPDCTVFVDGGSLPACWSDTGTGDAWQIAGTWPGFGIQGVADNSGFIGVDGSSNFTDNSLVSGNYDLTGYVGTPQISFDVLSDNTNTPGDNATLNVEISTDGGTTWAALTSYAGDDPAAVEVSAVLTAYIGSTITFRFSVDGSTMTGSHFYNDILINNVCVEEAPSCIAPTVLTATNIMATQADLGWTENNSPPVSLWDIELGTAGFTPTGTATQAGVATNPYTYTGLTDATSYDYYVRADCGSGASAWAGPFSFTTPCIAVTSYPDCTDFDAGMPTCWMQSTTDDFDWSFGASTPSGGTGPQAGDHTSGSGQFAYIETSSGAAGQLAVFTTGIYDVSSLTLPYLSFWHDMFGAQIGTLDVESSTDGVTWTNEFTLSGDQGSGWNEGTATLSSYVGATTLQFRITATHAGTFAGDISIDDFCVQEAPTCIAPTVLTATNIMATQADLGWTENNSPPVSLWDIELGAAGFTPTGTATQAGVTMNPYTYTGLSSDTNYEFYVRADCGGSGASTWAGPFAFKTPCLATVTSFPYFEGFEAGAGGWQVTDNGGNSSWALGTPANTVINSAGEGSSSWATNLTGDYNTNDNSMVESPCMDFSSLTTPVVCVKVWFESEFSWDGAALMSSIDGGATWTAVGSSTSGGTNWYNDNTIGGAPGGQQEGWTGRDGTGSDGWVFASHTMPALGGESLVKFGMAFGSDGSVTDEGFAFDAFSVYEDGTETCGLVAASAGACTNGIATNVTGAGGAGVWIDLTDASGNLIASIEDTENLGSCTADFYTHADGNRIDGDLQNYMARNINIDVTTQPTNPVKVRLYYLDGDYTGLMAATETTNTTATPADLLITKYPSGTCTADHTTLTGASLVPNSAQGDILNGSYLETTVSSFSEFFMHETGDGSPLPVEFVSFTGQAEGKVNVLDWETASEINNSHFEVERSANGEDFVNIGRVEGNGNSTVAITYDFTDNAPLDIAYYRLKQVDYDGQYDYSNVITIVRTTKTIAIGNVRPNPTKGSTTIQFNSTQNAQLNLVITNVDGKVVANRTITAAEGINNTEIDLSGMANGVYFLSLGDNETRVSTRIVKAD